MATHFKKIANYHKRIKMCFCFYASSLMSFRRVWYSIPDLTYSLFYLLLFIEQIATCYLLVVAGKKIQNKTDADPDLKNLRIWVGTIIKFITVM